MKYASISGPSTKPNSPNKKAPPIIPTKTKTGDNFAFLETIYDLTMLSIVETNNKL